MKLEDLSDEELLARLRAHVGRGNIWLVHLLVYLAELDERRLFAEHACTSTWDFCVRKLAMSEGEATRRIAAARVIRDFPIARTYLERGAIHLCAIYALHKHLTGDNHEELLREAMGKTTRAVEEMIATRFPKPDIHPCIAPLAPQPALLAEPPDAVRPGVVASPTPTTLCPGAALSPTPTTPHVRSRVEPLSAIRYRVELTVSVETKAKLERIKDLMRHRNPSGDLEKIVDVALDLLLTKLEKERFGKGVRSRRKMHNLTIQVDDAARATPKSPTAAPKTSPAASAQTSPAGSAQASPDGAQSSPAVSVQTSTAASAQTSPAVSTQTSPTASTQTSPAASTQTSPAASAQSSPAVSARTSPDGAQTCPAASAPWSPGDAQMEPASSDQLKRMATDPLTAATSAPPCGRASRAGDGDEPERPDAHGSPATGGAGPNMQPQRTAVATTGEASEVRTVQPKKNARRRHIPRETQREVVARDGEQCTYVDADGNRCPARGFLELDHVEPRALGGGDDAGNLRLRCRAHNYRHAEQVFGREYVAQRVHARRRTRAATVPPPFEAAARGLCNLGFRGADVRNAIARLAAGLDPSTPAESILRDALKLLT